MAQPKSLNFAQLRVLVGPARPSLRTEPAAARATETWRRASWPASVRRPVADDPPAEPRERSPLADVAGEGEGMPRHPEPAAARADATPPAADGPPPEARARAAQPQPQAAAAPLDPVATLPPGVGAIARAVARARLLRDLGELIVEFCGEEAHRRAGPWEMTMPLTRFGFGGTRLHLRLSSQGLVLRFLCDGRAAMDALCAHGEELQSQLHAQIRPPLDVQLEWDMA